LDAVETTVCTVLGALATVLCTSATVDCTGDPDAGAGLDGVLLELAGAGAELRAELEDPDAGAAAGFAADVGAVDAPPAGGELGLEVALEPRLGGGAGRWDEGVEPTAPGPEVP
jgi:hypothetical protein